MSKEWGYLGPLIFQLRSHPEQVSGSQKDAHAEHACIEARPKLQWMGLGLQEWNLDCRIHQTLSDPTVFIKAAKDLMGKGKHWPFSTTNGGYLGEFVVEEVGDTWTLTDWGGAICDAGVKIRIKEWVED
jgi:phage protein U